MQSPASRQQSARNVSYRPAQPIVKPNRAKQLIRCRKIAKFLKRRVRAVEALIHTGTNDIAKITADTEAKYYRSRLRVIELSERCEQLEKDYDRLQRQVEQFKPDKYCRTCSTTKPLSAFPRDPDKTLGVGTQCNSCKARKHRIARAAKKVAVG